MKEVLIIAAIAIAVIGMVTAGGLFLLFWDQKRILRELRDEGFYD